MRPRLQEPIDVLEVLVDEADKSKGVMYYGFSGCHRYEAHQRLGLETIRCKVRRATRRTLQAVSYTHLTLPTKA